MILGPVKHISASKKGSLGYIFFRELIAEKSLAYTFLKYKLTWYDSSQFQLIMRRVRSDRDF